MSTLEPATPKPKKTFLLVLAGLLVLGLLGYVGNWILYVKDGRKQDAVQSTEKLPIADPAKIEREIEEKGKNPTMPSKPGQTQ